MVLEGVSKETMGVDTYLKTSCKRRVSWTIRCLVMEDMHTITFYGKDYSFHFDFQVFPNQRSIVFSSMFLGIPLVKGIQHVIELETMWKNDVTYLDQDIGV